MQGRFEGSGWEFVKRGWLLWLLGVLSVTVLFGLFPLSIRIPALAPWLKLEPLLVVLMLPAAPFLFGVFRAFEWRWWISGIRFGEVRLQSTLSGGELFGLYWKVIGWMVLLSAAFGGYVFLSMLLVARASQTPMEQLAAPGRLQGNLMFLALMGIGYLAFILLINVVMRVYLMRDVWQRVLASVSVHGIEAAANVAAKGELASALGEGFADGLDVAGF